jgi:hypothetical protein
MQMTRIGFRTTNKAADGTVSSAPAPGSGEVAASWWILSVYYVPIIRTSVYADDGEAKSQLSHNALCGAALVQTGAKKNE